MAKSLRNKLANMALCCTVVTGTVGQITPVFAQSEIQSEAAAENQAVSENEITMEDGNADSEAESIEESEQAEDLEEEEVEQAEDLDAEELEQAKDLTEEIKQDADQEIDEIAGGSIKESDAVGGQDKSGIEQIEDPWTEETADTVHYGAIKVLKADSDADSMAAQFFTTENLPIEIVDGKVYLKLKVSKDGLGVKDAITSLEQKAEGVGYEKLTLKYADNDEVRYVITEINFENIEEAAILRCGINTGFMTMNQELRIFLTEGTINYLKAQGVGAEKKQVAMNVVHTDETAYGAADGIITITAAGGSGDYEYTIDGGQSWKKEKIFENLAAGTYEAAARDAADAENITAFETVTINAKEKPGSSEEIAEGQYQVDIEVLHETKDEASHAAVYFAKENAALSIREGKAYLTLKVARDAGSFTDMMKGLDLLVGDNYEALELSYEEDATGRYIVTEIALDSLSDTAYVKCHVVIPIMPPKEYPVRIRLTAESIKKILEIEKPEEAPETAPVEVSVEKADGMITVTAAGGSGEYEYTIDGGVNWNKENSFTGLAAGIYKVGARDAQNEENISAFHEVEIARKESSSDEGLKDGYYSVNISVLHETQDTASMAGSFFNTQELPLRIVNGEAYLTIQVLKDGMGMKDVITSLEQRIGSEYSSLYLNYLNDSSKRYITAEVKLSSLSDTAYLRCGITPMGGMKPVLRIKLDQSSLTEGAGSINTGLRADETATISKVEAENGKVTITLSNADETLTASDFTGKIYLNDSETGSDLTLKDFKMEEGVVTFTYKKIEAAEKDQKVTIGITLNGTETKADTYTVKGLTSISPAAVLSLKENAQEIKYIKGYDNQTFKPNGKVTKAEALSMLSLLVEGVKNTYYSANISILQANTDETSMAGQFFKNDGIAIKKQGESYLVELEIANEGLGFSDIITSVEQKTDGSYQKVEVRKTVDMKTAYVTLEVKNLEDAITLKTGIAPMGSAMPELRIIVDTKSLTETGFVSGYTDVDMWAKEAITLFEEAGVIGEGDTFSPNAYMTRAEFVKIIAQLAGLEVSADYEHGFKDLTGHSCEQYVAAAAEAGYINGYGNQTFKPEGTVTRAEAVKIINKFIGHTEETDIDTENPFKDLSASHWAYDEILKVTQF